MPCEPCCIPKKDLTLSITGLPGITSTTLVWNTLSANLWLSACHLVQNWNLNCQLGTVRFEANVWNDETECFPGAVSPNFCSYTGTSPNQLLLIDYTCNPFHLHFRADGLHCGLFIGVDFYIDE